MSKPRLIIAGISAALIIAGLFYIDCQHFISRSNMAPFLGILGMVFNIVSMILSNRHEINHLQTERWSEITEVLVINPVKE